MKKIVKTYTNRIRRTATTSGKVTKHKLTKNRIIVKELPKPTGEVSHDSVKVETNNTFDKLLIQDVSTKYQNKGNIFMIDQKSSISCSSTKDKQRRKDKSDIKKRTLERTLDNSLSYYVEPSKNKQISEKSDTYSFLKVDSFDQLSRSNYSSIFENLGIAKSCLTASTPLKSSVENKQKTTQKRLSSKQISMVPKSNEVDKNIDVKVSAYRHNSRQSGVQTRSMTKANSVSYSDSSIEVQKNAETKECLAPKTEKEFSSNIDFPDGSIITIGTSLEASSFAPEQDEEFIKGFSSQDNVVNKRTIEHIKNYYKSNTNLNNQDYESSETNKMTDVNMHSKLEQTNDLQTISASVILVDSCSNIVQVSNNRTDFELKVEHDSSFVNENLWNSKEEQLKSNDHSRLMDITNESHTNRVSYKLFQNSSSNEQSMEQLAENMSTVSIENEPKRELTISRTTKPENYSSENNSGGDCDMEYLNAHLSSCRLEEEHTTSTAQSADCNSTRKSSSKENLSHDHLKDFASMPSTSKSKYINITSPNLFDSEDDVFSELLEGKLNCNESCEGVLEKRDEIPRAESSRRLTRLTSTFPIINAETKILGLCGQTEPIHFKSISNDLIKSIAKKIGEGAYGEVFYNKERDTVSKIMPIEGRVAINGEAQKNYEEVLSEILVARELSNLRQTEKNRTTSFSELINIFCVQGKYPKHLLDLWQIFDHEKGSENDCPDILEDDQIFIVLEFANGGEDLETFAFNNALQALSAFNQVALSLAIAEKALQFEHRDLHLSNILVKNVDKKKTITFCLDDKQVQVQSNGVQICIIDFTLSRMLHDDNIIYNDLSKETGLFESTGDYQFDMYRLMKNELKNNWKLYAPKTNVYWLHFLVSKLVSKVCYKYAKSKTHSRYMKVLKTYQNVLLNFKCTEEFVKCDAFVTIS